MDKKELKISKEEFKDMKFGMKPEISNFYKTGIEEVDYILDNRGFRQGSIISLLCDNNNITEYNIINFIRTMTRNISNTELTEIIIGKVEDDILSVIKNIITKREKDEKPICILLDINKYDNYLKKDDIAPFLMDIKDYLVKYNVYLFILIRVKTEIDKNLPSTPTAFLSTYIIRFDTTTINTSPICNIDYDIYSVRVFGTVIKSISSRLKNLAFII